MVLRPRHRAHRVPAAGRGGHHRPLELSGNLALSPLAAALAAGNRVLIKPSELTPKTSDLLATMIRELFTVTRSR